MSVVRININGREIETSSDKNILQVALENGIDIPHLCYDERMEAYGGCGLCVVEIEGIKKLQRACATPVRNGMIIKTHTPRTIATRKTALKLLTSDHRGDCRPPCVLACPAHTDCQGYVGLIANGQFKEALKLIKERLPLPACIGRVCPHPCEDNCRRRFVDKPISIAALKAFVADLDLEDESYIPTIGKPSGKKVAVVGAGPAGLSAAFFLAKSGHKVVIYEAMAAAGGMLRYGMPEYRLPKDVLDKEIKLIEKMGVEIKLNSRLGVDFTLEFLRKHYDAVFLGLGAWTSRSLGCKGEDADGVMGGIEFLKDVATNSNVKLGNKVVVIGGGNTAMDVARTAVRLGANEVTVMYRRTRDEMPAEEIEIVEAEEEGVKFEFLLSPSEVITDGGKVTGLKLQKMRLGEPDASGRRRPEPIPGEEVIFEADTVISATGQLVSIGNIDGLSTTKRGTIEVNESTFETSIPGVFAGGDAVSGPKRAIDAIGQAKNAARVIDSYLNGEIKPIVEPYYVKQEDLTEEDFADREKKERVQLRVLSPEFRKTNFHPINQQMTAGEAMDEASRCLECGCQDYFECQLYKYINEYDIDPDKLKGEKHDRNKKEEHPFIERNPDKCVLCGLCVRACDEIMGITALGLVDRGFESVVAPEFGLPLKNTDCISCGQCVDVCPTGACIEKSAVDKQVPVEFNETDSVCGYCGVGCNLVMESRGNLVFKSRPNKKVEEGILCGKGRFGIEHINSKDRLVTPFVNKEGRFAPMSWEIALNHMVKKLQSVRGIYGENSIAIIASPRFTNEEFFVINKLAENLNTDLVGSFSIEKESGLEKVFGYNASTNSYKEMKNTDVILSVGMVAENHPVAAVKIKDAIANRGKLLSISPKKTRLEQWADLSLNLENNIEFIKGITKAIIDLGYADESRVEGFEKLKEAVKDVNVTEEMKNIASIYGEAKSAMIVIDEDTVTNKGIKLLANIAALTGKVGKPYSGIIVVRQKNNSQGAWDMGVRKSGEEIVDLINQGKVKAAVILGENPVGINAEMKEVLNKLEFLAVGDMFMTETAKISDTILPLVDIAETTGSVTRSDRRIQYVNPAIESKVQYNNLDMILEISNRLGIDLNDIEDIRNSISKEVSEYKGFAKADGRPTYWPNSNENIEGTNVLYMDGFATENGKAHLYIPSTGELFKEKVVYDTIEKDFIDFARKEGLNI